MYIIQPTIPLKNCFTMLTRYSDSIKSEGGNSDNS